RAAPFHGRVVAQRHLRRLDEDLAAPAIVVDVVGHEDPLAAVVGAVLQHEDLAVLEHDLRFDLPEARRADRERHVVEDVRPDAIGHDAPSPGASAPASSLRNIARAARTIRKMNPRNDTSRPTTKRMAAAGVSTGSPPALKLPPSDTRKPTHAVSASA